MKDQEAINGGLNSSLTRERFSWVAPPYWPLELYFRQLMPVNRQLRALALRNNRIIQESLT
jgi:hypothetical protein